ncbi:IMP dehydrogenase [Mycobacterium saskatchewanense]|uniref:IMP dehydrogenase n=2 Tax=Mycobacterium saskatchewanense TaxID=220927 RepID=A0AAJ3TTX3_9MYCO|nr:zinc-dependent alcohol dehydrogenase family protein [Mycobacterium saskatchewanense]ORW69101.1 IMP dehydrogenase [Mycobacterium saskatchewanense]
MRAAVFLGERTVECEYRPDPHIVDPADAIVRVGLASVCGSDLWHYRGLTDYVPGSPIGHEFIGIVEQVGSDVATVAPGDFVISPWSYSDGTCPNCRAGMTTACVNGGFIPRDNHSGGQGELVRLPLADGTLVKVPGSMADYSTDILASLLTLSDVMGTGNHAAVSAEVQKGDTVAVVGDGAVGLCGVIAAKRLGAERIVALSRNPSRQRLAERFGATDVVAERGEDAVAAVKELTGGIGVDAALECVGTNQSMQTAIGICRAGAMVGNVGLPHGVEISAPEIFARNVGVHGGTAPVRVYLPELMGDVLTQRIDPGKVFDFRTDLDSIGVAYAAMDERRAIKSLVTVADLF